MRMKRPKEVMWPLTGMSIFWELLSMATANVGLRYGNPIVTFDPKAEARLRLKIDLYIVPTVSLLYLFCFIDRANIGEPTLWSWTIFNTDH